MAKVIQWHSALKVSLVGPIPTCKDQLYFYFNSIYVVWLLLKMSSIYTLYISFFVKNIKKPGNFLKKEHVLLFITTTTNKWLWELTEKTVVHAHIFSCAKNKQERKEEGLFLLWTHLAKDIWAMWMLQIAKLLISSYSPRVDLHSSSILIFHTEEKL